MSQQDIGAEYLADALRNFRSYKKLAEEALAQTTDEEIFRLIDPEANSIAIIIKHMGGNMRSRWTDFLTTDGEKPNRHRDQEFEIAPGTTRADVMQLWEEGWECGTRRSDSAEVRRSHAEGVDCRPRALGARRLTGSCCITPAT